MPKTTKKFIISRGFLLLLLLVVPILQARGTLDPETTLQFVALAFLLGMGWAFFANIFSSPLFLGRANHWFLFAFILFLAYSLVSVGISNNRPDAFFFYGKYLLFFILAFSVQLLKNPGPLVRFVPIPATILALILLVPAYLQLIGLIHENQLTIPVSTYSIQSFMPHRNLFAEMLVLALPFSVFLSFIGKRPWKAMGMIVSCLSIFMLVVLSNRASWLAVLAIGLFSAIAWALNRKGLKWDMSKKIFLLLVGITLVAGLVFLTRFSVKDSLETHAFESLDYTRGSTKDRVELWSRTLTLVSEKPLLGHGLGSWKINMLQFGNEDLASENNTSFYQRPHNDFLWLAAEQGLLGLALYLFVFLTVIGKGLKVFFKNNQQGLSGFTWAVASVTIAFLVYSCLGFPKERIAHNIFLFTAWGLFLNRSRPQGGEGEREGTGEKNPFQWPVFILLAGLVVLGLFRLNGEIHAKKAILAKKSGRYQRCVQEISRARSFVYQLDETSTPLSWYAGFSHFKTGQYSKALPHFEEAYQANPYHLHVLNDYAGCLAKTGRARQAKKYYRQALGVAPNYSPARLNLCAIYFNQGQYALAYETLKKLDANDPSPRYKKTVKVILQTILLEQLNSTRQNTAVFHHVQEQNHYAFYKQLLHGLKNHDIQYESIAKYTIDTFQEPKNN